MKDKEFYRVGVARHMLIRPRILAAMAMSGEGAGRHAQE